MLTVKDLSYRIGEQEILKNVQAHFRQGRMTAIVGPNGSGKSTLLSFLSRDKPSSGQVFLQGRDVSTIEANEYARLVAVLPQQRETIADFMVKDVVVMGRFPYKQGFRDYTKEDRRIAAEAMEQAGVSSMAERRISHMSGGEIQRVMIAKTLAQRSQLVLLDEPTNHLDVKYKLALMKTLQAYEGTVVMVLHDLSLAVAFCHDVIMMKKGSIVKQGAAGEVLEPGLLQEVFGVPFVRYEHEGRIYLNY
ncbi:ABC transporter ATP-binding protein [Selenomonas sp. KH1T6]|uniref:ABC transporter ATP-binding protein n=1 Tax=Selenomonas sp. KH1T6 TaxID=3158784 RepID=UPI0008A7F37B|nr:iron complex transport system ATP-binding protein [Selenomonas ruminantium]